MKSFADIAFTPAVQDLQAQDGSRAAYARMQRNAVPGEGFGPREIEHFARSDSFFVATVGATGWPYVQHRGGPAGFLRPVGASRLAFADFAGNRQFVSAGNAAGDDRAALIVMDYARRRRLKVYGRLRFVAIDEAGPALAAAVAVPGYAARVERVGIVDVEALDWNCPQHLPEVAANRAPA